MNIKVITNRLELRAEIAGLREQETAMKSALALRFKGPTAIFFTLKSLFPKYGEKAGAKGLMSTDLLQTVSRFLIPFALNKTIFRRSNFLVRALVGLVSQKAAGFVTEDLAGSLLAKGQLLFEKWFSKDKGGHKPLKKFLVNSTSTLK